jgi:primary-amine oxidase
MSRPRILPGAVCAVLGLLLGTLLVLPGTAAPSRATSGDDDLGCPDQLVEHHLPNGSSWRLCVRIHPFQGLVLEDVEFRPATGDREYTGYKRILDSLHLAQLNVPYDNGGTFYNDITEYGFGGDHLVAQNADTCPGQARPVTYVSSLTGAPVAKTVSGICLDEVATGLAFQSQERSNGSGPRFAAQGTALEISSLAKVSWYEYQQKITLDDQGGIDVGLGATGDIAPSNALGIFFTEQPATGWPLGPPIEGHDHYATSHWHSAIYRVDFGIDSATRQVVEQWDYTAGGSASRPTLLGTPTIRDRAFAASPSGDHDRLTWWRVFNPDSLNPDGHPRSYEIVNDNPVDIAKELTSIPVAFTNAAPCQQYASFNLDPGCPDQDVLDYVAGDDAPLTDPVAWVNVGFHHIDRDEDQSPMHTHWQSFHLLPRDFFAQGPATPDARSCINGPEPIDSSSKPCVATVKTPPTVSASATPVTIGTQLGATPGTWNEARTTWDYAYLWFRDGSPITGVDEHGVPTAATGPTYVVGDADLGHRLTVKVTASHPGYASGTAESAALTIPGRPATVHPPAPAPAVPLVRAVPSIRVAAVTRVHARHRARLVVRVSARTSPTGVVVARVRGKRVRGRLVAGRVVLRLPALRKRGRARMVVSYLGSPTVVPAQRVVTLRVLRRR